MTDAIRKRKFGFILPYEKDGQQQIKCLIMFIRVKPATTDAMR